MLTSEQVKKIKNGSYLSWVAAVGWLAAIGGIILFFVGGSGSSGMMSGMSGVFLFFFGLFLAGIGAVHSQLKLITAILAPELAEEEKKADA